MAEYDLKIALTKLGARQMNFAFYRGADADQILISSKPPAPKMVAEMEKECGACKRILKGIVYLENGTTVFAIKMAPSPMWEKQMTAVFKERKAAKFLPLILRQLRDDEAEEVSFEEGEGSPAAPASAAPAAAVPPLKPAATAAPAASTATPPPPVPAAAAAAPPVAPPPPPPVTAAATPGADVRAQWEQLKATMVPKIKEALAANPSLRDRIAPLFSEALGQEKAGAFAAAIAAMQRLEPLLAPAAPPPPPVVGTGPGADLLAELNKLAPQIKQTIAEKPQTKEGLLGAVGQFQAAHKAGDLSAAQQILQRIREMLHAASETAAAAAPDPAASTSETAPAFEKSAAPFDGQAVLEIWQEAKELADQQIEALRTALLREGRPQLARVANEGITGGGLNAITGGLMVQLWTTLLECKNGANANQRKAAAQAAAALRTFLTADQRVALCEKNPVGVAVDLRGPLGTALTKVEQLLAA